MTPTEQPRQTDAGGGSWTEATAAGAFRLLRVHAVSGYEPGDCHCDTCGIIVDDLCDYLGASPATHSDPDTGIYSPAVVVREAAATRGWR